MKITPDNIKPRLIKCGLCGKTGHLYFKKCDCEHCLTDPTILAYHETHCVAVKPMNMECIWWDNDYLFKWVIDFNLEVV